MSAYEEALGKLNQAQRLAVTTTEGPVLVIAGPGTGKTQLLTTRIAHLLATTDASPQNILCLTFTDSAAHTMRQRLASMIGQAAYDVTISTYHAFGSDLIRRHPDYFVNNAGLEPIDDLGIDELFRSILEQLPYDNPLAYPDLYLRDIKTLVSDAKRALLTPNDLRAIANDNLSYIACVSDITSELLGNMVRISKKDIPLFRALAEQLATLGGHDKHTSEIVPLSVTLLQELQAAVAAAEETDKATPLTKWKNAWLAKDAKGLFVMDGERTNQKLLAAADVYEHYLQQLAARGLFDYDDMILRAVHALETNDDLRYTLQEQYLYILLDEFQDTNGAQLRIVELLTDNPANEGRPNILAVGDDDQAIYAFQGANYSHMLRFNELYRDVLPVPLTQNYRSHAAILATARGIAEQIEERLHHHFPQIEKTLTAENTDLRAATIERREAHSDVMQFAWVATRIKQLIADGMSPSDIAVLAPQHKYLEPLVPFLQRQGLPVHYDKRENVLDDPAIVQLERMAELVLALADGDKSKSDTLWAEVMSFAFWQLPTSVIWSLSWQSRDDDQTWTETLMADANLRPIALFFIRLSQLAATQPLEIMLDYLIGSTPLDLGEPDVDVYTSPYYRHYFGDSSRENTSLQIDLFQHIDETKQATFWELLTNLVVLRARLREYKRGESELLVLRDFVQFIAAHRSADIKILNTSPYSSGDDAVQLMTAFKSKGMEFGAVFVLAVTEEAWSTKARGAINCISLPPNLQFIRYAGATNDERLRLFYVAITRAKTQLYLVNYTTDYAGKAMNRLKYLNETTDERYVLQSPLLPEGSQEVLPAEEQLVQPTTELAAYWQQRHEQALTDTELRAVLKERLAHYQLSPTHVNDFTDLVHCGPTGFFLRTILRFPQAAAPQVHFGNAMHETLEWVHVSARQHGGALPTEQTILQMFEERLMSKQLSHEDQQQFLARGKKALRAYTAQRLQTISADNVVEYNFRNEGVFIGQAHLAGKIDKLIINKESKTITIVDFKTGKSHSRWTRDVKLHKYRQQLYLYRALVEGSHTFRGYSVTDAFLEFVEPDDNGIIQELHVIFDDAEYKRIKRLTEVIWQCITTISLPDTQGYTADMAGIEHFESDLLAKRAAS